MKRAILISFLTLGALSLGGCFEQHGQDGPGERCGPTVCAEGLVCCNESCGICAAPGEGCIALACADAGPIDPPLPPRVQCGLERALCDPGVGRCCPGCERGAEFCPAADGTCPELVCPDVCADGERSCVACESGDRFCVSEGEMCPSCPPDGCLPGEVLCVDCDSGAEFCAPFGECPGCDRPMECETNEDCLGGEFCETLGCGVGGLCFFRPNACGGNFDPVCGCDGSTYSNACLANAEGVPVGSLGECETAEPCEGRDYCGCNEDSACAPLVDLSTGCICECEEPFACMDTTPACLCACGGATYLGCAPAERCAETQITCGPGVTATLGPDGCPQCGA
ncbi:MAG: hypothetical protein AB8I08_23835 [Sandaracinaceae bacterium]